VNVRDFASRVTSIATLGEPVRRTLYMYVVAQADPVSREEAAAALGVPLHVAKFNLDKLEEQGLLDVEFARPPGRRGPGAGRPAKLYKRSVREVEVSLPERHYDLAAQVMAQAITESEDRVVPIGDALRDAAREAGRALGEQAKETAGARPSRAGAFRAVQQVLADKGYEPREEGDGLVLANCPFHTLAQAHRDLVCGINLDLIDSLLQAAGPPDIRAELRPSPGRCCVQIIKA
jgi:predicted ArsR family transcriptional regulator